MTIVLDGHIAANSQREYVLDHIQSNDLQSTYVAIIFLGDNPASQAYVKMKQKYGNNLGIDVRIYGQDEKPLRTLDDVFGCITACNNDDYCIGILVQLPIPGQFTHSLSEILASVAPHKDIDGLGGVAFGRSMVGLFDFYPATPSAVFGILDYYGLGDVQGKNVVVLGQSHLIGKPLAYGLMHKGATVISCNAKTDASVRRSATLQADIIISATGVPHLIGLDDIRHDKTQILIDVGWSKRDGKVLGDMDYEKVFPLVQAITPVPGGIGPMTIACLFSNIAKLHWMK